MFSKNHGALNRNRTDDLILTMDALYLLSYEGESGGDKRIRTADPLLARQVLYQLSYIPEMACPKRFELLAF